MGILNREFRDKTLPIGKIVADLEKILKKKTLDHDGLAEILRSLGQAYSAFYDEPRDYKLQLPEAADFFELLDKCFKRSHTPEGEQLHRYLYHNCISLRSPMVL